jgi:hypothetical protein
LKKVSVEMAFIADISGRELIRLYAPYADRECSSYALVRPDKIYQVSYDPSSQRIGIVSDSVKLRDSSGTWNYLIGPSPMRDYFLQLRLEHGTWLGGTNRGWKLIAFPLHGHYRPLAYYAEFDKLVRDVGYTAICRKIDEESFPTMYRALLQQQARREVVPSLSRYSIAATYPTTALSLMPKELHGEVGRYIEALTSPQRRGIGRIIGQ